METLQNLLTIAIEVVTVAGFGGIALHAIWSGHCSWMKEYCPAIEPTVEPTIEPAVEPTIEPTIEPVIELTVEPMTAKYEAMNVKSLRQECQVRCIDWRRGGDYGRSMRKNQMIRALTA